MARKSDPRVTVTSGQLEGYWDGDIAVYKGVPFAQPPVGELRWRPPQPLLPWEGVRPAKQASASAMQMATSIERFLGNLIEGQGWNPVRTMAVKTLFRFAPRPPQSEDCLYLNIRTPAEHRFAKLPVMVWFHGGDHHDGSGTDPLYDSNRFADLGIILVTVNYRLGLMGYYMHPELSAESEQGVSGNYGTLDQICALQWVRDNIAAFGGDPDNVTIFGESAGGESVIHMMSSPLAHGLFNRAIAQSAANGGQMIHLRHAFIDYPSGEDLGLEFARLFGLSGEDQLAQLRELPVSELYRAARSNESTGFFYPSIDGYVLPLSPFETFAAGLQADVPLLIGSNADEASLLFDFFGYPIIEYRFRAWPDSELPDFVKDDFGDDLDVLIEQYPGLDTRDRNAEVDLSGDVMFGSKARWYAGHAAHAGQPTYFYMFKRVPPSPNQTAGGFHAAEIPFVFGSNSPVLPLTKDDQILSEKMSNYWAEFAKRGNPNGNSLPEWEQFDGSDPRWMVFDIDQVGMAPVDREGKYTVLNSLTAKRVEMMQTSRLHGPSPTHE